MPNFFETKSFRDAKDEWYDITGGDVVRNPDSHGRDYRIARDGDVVTFLVDGQEVRIRNVHYEVDGNYFESLVEAHAFAWKEGIYRVKEGL